LAIKFVYLGAKETTLLHYIEKYQVCISAIN